MAATAPDALLAWLNSFPELQHLHATSLSDFRDGVALCLLWNSFGSPAIDIAALAKPRDSSDWLSCMQNLRTLDQTAAPVLSNRKMADLGAIARDGQIDELVKFIEPFLIPSLGSPAAADQLKGLDPSVRVAIWLLLGADIEHEVVSMRNRVDDLESQLRELDGHATKLTRADAGQADLIARTEEMIGELEAESAQIFGRLPALKIEEDRLRSAFDSVKSSCDHLIQAKQAYNERLQEATLLDMSLSDFLQNKETLERMRSECAPIEAEVRRLEGEIEQLKADITTAVQLTEKYGGADFGSAATANESPNELHQLATQLSQLEAEIALIRDSLEAGFTGVPLGLAAEREDLEKVMKRRTAKKKKLEAGMAERRTLADELQRVEQLMRAQREEVDEELARLAHQVNKRNIEISNWVSLASSFNSWSTSKTFISKLRRKYLQRDSRAQKVVTLQKAATAGL
jgi:predicted nuclease with TOPRIM domain